MDRSRDAERASATQSIVDWMIDGARTVRLPQDILDELCRRLTAVGVPLHRAAVFVRTLHPDIMGRRFLWRPGEEVIGLLNDYFDCVVPPIEAHGGEVVKYMGDGVLAIFPLADTDPKEVCQAALAVAADASRNLAERNADLAARAGPRLRHALAFHIGDVLYGNIGGSNRLDFTAIGRGVNRTARLQTVAAEVGRDLVTSAAFAEHCGEALVRLARFAMKGFDEPQDVFGLPEH